MTTEEKVSLINDVFEKKNDKSLYYKGICLEVLNEHERLNKIIMDLSKLKRNPKEYNGWNYDYKFISTISQLTKDSDYPLGMEEAESAIIALEKAFKIREKQLTK
jgi:hypothetical protein